MRIHKIITALFVAAISACACNNKEEPTGNAEALKAVLTFKNYKTEKGVSGSVSLSENEPAVLIDLTSGETLTKEPLSGGSNNGTFLFEPKKAASGDDLFLYYPSSSNPKIGNGSAVFNIPATQNGGPVNPVFVGAAKNSGSSYRGTAVTMEPIHTYVLGTVQKGAYSIVSATMKSNAGEGIAGDVTVDMKTGKITGASASTIKVNFATPLNCREENMNAAIEVAAVSLSRGFTITYTTDGGDKIEYSTSDPVTFTCDDVFRTDPASSGRMLIACGSNKVYIFDESLARASGNYKDGLIWEWDASTAKSVIGGNMDHIDDAKPVNDNKQILVTSSYNWAALVDIATKKVLWYATGVTGAHSAEILPGNLIAVACSGEHVMLFDASMPNKKLAQYDLGSAHGVVWMESVQRLYAIGGTTLQKYRVMGNALSLDQTFDTKSAVTGLHDMTKYDSNTLIMTGSRAALFNVNTNTFTNIPHFNGFVGMKSINCNPDTGEVYYTFGAEGLSEGSYTWSSHWIRYSDNYMAATPGGQTLAVDGYIRVEDINMYKVRVFSW